MLINSQTSDTGTYNINFPETDLFKRKKRYRSSSICVLFMLIICLCIISCSKESEIAETKDTENKVYSLQALRYAPYENGWIYLGYTDNINYFDQKTGQSTPLCNKKNCNHEAWDETTPLEQRCNAYREFPISAIMVHNNKLYSLSNNFSTEKVDLYRSNIDGTEIEKITELNMFFTTGSAMFDEEYIYYTSIVFNPERKIDEPNDRSNFVVSINRANLSTGKDEIVSEVYKGMSTSMQIIGKHNSNIYYKVFSLKPDFEKMEGMESIDTRVYVVDLNTRESKQVFTDISDCFTINDIIVDDYLYLTSQDPSNMEKREKLFYYPNTIYRIDLKNNSREEITSFIDRGDRSNRCDDWLYFPLEDSQQIKFINLFSGAEKILKKEPYQEYYLNTISNDQLILVVEKFEIDPENSSKGSGEMVILSGSLSDFFAGEFEGRIIQ
ncbi:hypothetical protein [Globicatella sulfidifaciens]|uniref:DUF5050 domain-containing protein n=1 Tax=Globicatella sulfidifaciens TaxID=136093 RepID=A0A7X8C632_9LACT|nr:hypothetical protein [Globicatella sulfidifaciens]NLJ19335.1 hypothetical protein [Globicatella sulfidifaciens]